MHIFEGLSLCKGSMAEVGAGTGFCKTFGVRCWMRHCPHIYIYIHYNPIMSLDFVQLPY